MPSEFRRWRNAVDKRCRELHRELPFFRGWVALCSRQRKLSCRIPNARISKPSRTGFFYAAKRARACPPTWQKQLSRLEVSPRPSNRKSKTPKAVLET